MLLRSPTDETESQPYSISPKGNYPYNTAFSAFLAKIKLQYLYKYLILLPLFISY